MSFPNNTQTAGVSPFGNKQATNTYNTPQFQLQSSSTAKGKPRGGWADDEDDQQPQQKINKPTESQPTPFNTNKPALSVNIFNKNTQPAPKPVVNEQADKNLAILNCDEAFFGKNEYEYNMISELIQPSGARLKHSDAILNNFCKACESLQIDVVGSILIYNLSAPVAWNSKAKAIYAIEGLVKKNKKYFSFFHHNLKALESHQFLEDGANAGQLKKILGEIVGYINEPEKPKIQPFPNSSAATPTSQPNQNSNVSTPTQVGPSSFSAASTPVKSNPFGVANKPGQSSFAPAPIKGQSQSLPQSPEKHDGLTAQLQAQAQAQAQAQTPTQIQAQAKPNPFGITPVSAGAKPSSGLPGNFKAKANNVAAPSPNNSSSQVQTQAPAQQVQTQAPVQQVQVQVQAQPQVQQQVQATPVTQPQAQAQPTSQPKGNDEKLNSIMNSLSGLDFGGNQGNSGINQLYGAYNNNGYGYNMPMPYPDPNMMGYPGPGPNVYPDPGFNGYPYPQQMPPPQFDQYGQPFYPQPQYNPYMQGQFPPQFNPAMGHPMQGYPNQMPPQGYGYYQGHPNRGENQNNGQQIEQNQQENQQSQQNVQQAPKKEEPKISPEELQRRKQQEENEKKFDKLFNLL